jgi:hypothetical protein
MIIIDHKHGQVREKCQSHANHTFPPAQHERYGLDGCRATSTVANRPSKILLLNKSATRLPALQHGCGLRCTQIHRMISLHNDSSDYLNDSLSPMEWTTHVPRRSLRVKAYDEARCARNLSPLFGSWATCSKFDASGTTVQTALLSAPR